MMCQKRSGERTRSLEIAECGARSAELASRGEMTRSSDVRHTTNASPRSMSQVTRSSQNWKRSRNSWGRLKRSTTAPDSMGTARGAWDVVREEEGVVGARVILNGIWLTLVARAL